MVELGVWPSPGDSGLSHMPMVLPFLLDMVLAWAAPCMVHLHRTLSPLPIIGVWLGAMSCVVLPHHHDGPLCLPESYLLCQTR